MFVPGAGSCVQGFLGFLTHRLTRPQAANLRMMVLALLIGGSGKLRTLAAQLHSPQRHRTSLSRFLGTSAWPEADLLQRAAMKLLRSMRPRRGEVLSLLIDETIVAKKARTMDAVRKKYDWSAKRFCCGHTLLVVAVRFRGVTIPWQIELWLPRDFCTEQALEFRKLTQMAAEAINDFEPPKGVKVRVLFDAGFLCPPVVAACRTRGFRWFSVAARNRNLRRRNKPDRKIGDLGPGCLKHQSKRIRLRRAGGRWRWMHVAALEGSLKKIGEVRIVFSKRINDPSGHQLALATDETGLNPREVVAIYESRWWIEVLFKELKSHLELGAYQMQSWCGITRYLHTVCLAHITLTHHALSVLPTGKRNNAVGAQATYGNQDLRLPGITERLTDFRTASRRHRILKFLSRTKAPTRVKKRLQEFLMAT